MYKKVYVTSQLGDDMDDLIKNKLKNVDFYISMPSSVSSLTELHLKLTGKLFVIKVDFNEMTEVDFREMVDGLHILKELLESDNHVLVVDRSPNSLEFPIDNVRNTIKARCMEVSSEKPFNLIRFFGKPNWLEKEADKYVLSEEELIEFTKNILYGCDYKFYEDRGIDTNKRAIETIDRIRNLKI